MSPPATAVAEAPERDSDSALVAAVRRGDDRAFEQLYSRYQRRISAYVFGMVKDHGRAEDITQEVFISALRRMRETDRAIAFKPWVYEIAKNACIDQFRRSRRTEEVSFDAGEGGPRRRRQGRLVAAEPGRPTPRSTPSGGLRPPLRGLRRAVGLPTTRSSSCASSRASPTARSATAWASAAPASRARSSAPASAWGRSTTSSSPASAASASSRSSPPPRARPWVRATRAASPAHIAHCQPCRRQAVASGIDAAILTRKPVRQRVAEKVAGACCRSRASCGAAGSTAGEQIGPGLRGPMAAAWGKAVAVAATLVVAGVGAGVAPQHGGATPERAHQGQARRGAGPLDRHDAPGAEARAGGSRALQPSSSRKQRKREGRAPAAGATGRPPPAVARRPRSRGRRPAAARRARAAPRERWRVALQQPERPRLRPTPATRRRRSPRAGGEGAAPAASGRAAGRAPDASEPAADQPAQGRPARLGHPGGGDRSPTTVQPDHPENGQRDGPGQSRTWSTTRPAACRSSAAAEPVWRAAARVNSLPLVTEPGSDSFVESLMDTNLYSIGAYFHDRHPELVESVVDEAQAIERAGLEAYARDGGLDPGDGVPDARHGPRGPLLPSRQRLARLLTHRGVAQPGSARRSGRRGPRFKSGRPDLLGTRAPARVSSFWARETSR